MGLFSAITPHTFASSEFLRDIHQSHIQPFLAMSSATNIVIDTAVPSWELFLARYDRALCEIISQRTAQKEADEAARRASRGKRNMYEMEEEGEIGRSTKRARK